MIRSLMSVYFCGECYEEDATSHLMSFSQQENDLYVSFDNIYKYLYKLLGFSIIIYTFASALLTIPLGCVMRSTSSANTCSGAHSK